MTRPCIEVIVTAQGETRVETKGFTGASCRHASQFLEEALGAQVIERLTAEYYQHESSLQRVQQGGTS